MGSDRTSYRTRIVLGVNQRRCGVAFQVSGHILPPRQHLHLGLARRGFGGGESRYVNVEAEPRLG